MVLGFNRVQRRVPGPAQNLEHVKGGKKMPLTELEVKNARPKEKRYQLPDGNCLYLEITPIGTKSWKMRHFKDKKETTLTLGKYPDISLKDARTLRNDVKKRVAQGEEPLATRKEQKGFTFSELFEEYLEKRVLPIRDEARVKAVRRRMNNHALPRLGDKSVDEIDEVMLLEVLRAIEVQAKYETAHIIRGTCGQV